MDFEQGNRHRQVWPTQVGGFLVSIGFLTGLANMAFFPSTICAQGHAGNFIAVYLICIVVIGFPLTYLHLCLGQYSGCNPTDVFGKLSPAFKGIGWSWLLLMIPMMIISNMNTAWSLYYMYVSGTALVTNTKLPWSLNEAANFFGDELPSQLIDYLSIVNYDNKSDFNALAVKRPYSIQTTTPTYFHHLFHTSAPHIVLSFDDDKILRVVDKKIIFGEIEPRMVIALALSWMIVSMCTMHNSVHTMNRIVYVTATLPLLILSILCARVIYLPGAWDGIKLLYPNFDRITEKAVWQSAFKLIFFDMQIGVGVLISISKHNRFHTNVFRDAVLMVTIDMVVSLLAACVAFGFLGFMAFRLHTSDIRAMCRGQIAPHLLWDQILRSMTYLQPSEASVFSFMYQLMLALGALECTFTLCESFSSALDCRIPFLKNKPCFLRGTVAILLFFFTIPCCYQSGVHVYNLLVHYSMHWNLKIIALCQFVVIVFIYGVDNLFKDIALMLRLPAPGLQKGFMRIIGPTGTYVKHAWTWICPSVITVAIIFDLFIKEANRHHKKVGDSNFWHILSIVSILPLPICALFYIYKRDKTAFQATKWRALQMPFDDSTICNTFSTQQTELEDILIDRRKDCTVPNKKERLKMNPTTKLPVEFAISKGPYFEINMHHKTPLSDSEGKCLISDFNTDESNIDSDSECSDSFPSSSGDLFASIVAQTGQPLFMTSAPVPALPNETSIRETIIGSHPEPPPDYSA